MSIVAFALPSADSGAGPYQELVPTRNAYTDEEKTMAFYLGPLVFQIKNKFLVFPFAGGQHPFDASVCGRTDIQEFERRICAEPKRAVFLRIPLPDNLLSASKHPFLSSVTLGYGQQYVFDGSPIDKFVSEVHPWEGGRERTPKLDSSTYSAVREIPTEQIAKNPAIGESYFFVSKTEKSPHVVYCGAPNESDIPAKATCSARTGFLTEEFRQQSNGEFPFTVQYNFPGAELDHAPEIQAAVLKAISAFLPSPAASASGSSANQPEKTDSK